MNPRIADIRKVEGELIALKKEQRDPAQQPPKYFMLVGLARLKIEATVLYAATAEYRGKVHHDKWTADEQREFLDKHGIADQRPKEPAAVAA